LSVPVPPRSEWRGYVQAIEFHLHRFPSSVSVRRFAPTAHANVRTLQDDFPVTLHFKSADDRPAAVGFELEVDGFQFDLSLPGADALATSVLPPPLMAASKLGYLRDAFRADPDVPDELNGVLQHRRGTPPRTCIKGLISRCEFRFPGGSRSAPMGTPP
jgi:hypothetical protein